MSFAKLLNCSVLLTTMSSHRHHLHPLATTESSQSWKMFARTMTERQSSKKSLTCVKSWRIASIISSLQLAISECLYAVPAMHRILFSPKTCRTCNQRVEKWHFDIIRALDWITSLMHPVLVMHCVRVSLLACCVINANQFVYQSDLRRLWRLSTQKMQFPMSFSMRNIPAGTQRHHIIALYD